MTLFGAIGTKKLVLDRLLAVQPNDVESKSWRARSSNWTGKRIPGPYINSSIQFGLRILSQLQISPMNGSMCALAERDAAAAAKALAVAGENKRW